MEQKPVDDRLAVGRRGEFIALRHLLRRGLQPVARNFRCAAGELDLLMAQGSTLVVVEVRTIRQRRDGFSPLESIGPRKRRQVVRVTRRFLQCSDRGWARVRFDVVGVTLTGRGHHVRWLPDAFTPADC